MGGLPLSLMYVMVTVSRSTPGLNANFGIHFKKNGFPDKFQLSYDLIDTRCIKIKKEGF